MNIFLVEDSAAIRRLLLRRLDALSGVRVVGEACGERQALALIRWTQPDGVLLDLSLSNGSGLGTLAGLRTSGYKGWIAVLTSQDSEAYRDACLAAGADAFYDKASGLESLFEDLARRVPAQAEADGAPSLNLLRDGLTDLSYESPLCECIDRASRAAEGAHRDLAVYVLRLTGLGQLPADLAALLTDAAAQRLGEACSDAALVARCSGARFCVLQARVEAADQAASYAQHLGQLMRAPLQLQGREHRLGLELGMALFPADAVSPRGLLTLAEASAFGAL